MITRLDLNATFPKVAEWHVPAITRDSTVLHLSHYCSFACKFINTMLLVNTEIASNALKEH